MVREDILIQDIYILEVKNCLFKKRTGQINICIKKLEQKAQFCHSFSIEKKKTKQEKTCAFMPYRDQR